MSRRKVVISLWVLCALAFGLRLGVVIFQKGWLTPNAMEHRSIALSLVNGQGFSFGDWGYYGPTSVQSPPYPFFLATLFKIFGHGSRLTQDSPGVTTAFFVALLINCIAGGLLVFLVYAMTRTLGGSALAGIIAAALVAVWPTQVYLARSAQAIEFIVCALTGAIILFYRAMRSGNLGDWVAFAVVYCIATFTEPVFLPSLMIAGLLTLLWPTLTGWQRFRNGLALAITIAVIIGPWTMRNRIVQGKWEPIKATFWVNVWKGNNDYATGTDRLPMTRNEKEIVSKATSEFNDAPLLNGETDTARQYDMLDQSQRTRLHNQPEAFREGIFRQFATQWIQTHPKRYFELCGIRLWKTLTIDWDNPKSYNSIYIASRYALLGITVIGLFAAWRQKWTLLWPGIIAGTALLTYTLTVTAARFSMPFEPLQLALGTATVDMIARYRARRLAEAVDDNYEPIGVKLSPPERAGRVA